MFVAIVGARNRSSTEYAGAVLTDAMKQNIQATDRDLLVGYITKLHERYRSSLGIMSFGCDDGIGHLAKEICMKKEIKFAEIFWYFHGSARWHKAETPKIHISRNAAVLEIADGFLVFPNENRNSVVEDLINRLSKLATVNDDDARPYAVIDVKGNVESAFKKEVLL